MSGAVVELGEAAIASGAGGERETDVWVPESVVACITGWKSPSLGLVFLFRIRTGGQGVHGAALCCRSWSLRPGVLRPGVDDVTRDLELRRGSSVRRGGSLSMRPIGPRCCLDRWRIFLGMNDFYTHTHMYLILDLGLVETYPGRETEGCSCSECQVMGLPNRRL